MMHHNTTGYVLFVKEYQINMPQNLGIEHNVIGINKSIERPL